MENERKRNERKKNRREVGGREVGSEGGTKELDIINDNETPEGSWNKGGDGCVGARRLKGQWRQRRSHV